MVRKALLMLAAVSLSACATRSGALEKHPEWPDDVKADIMKGNVRIGMTYDQVMAAWGSSRYDLQTIQTASSSVMNVFFKHERDDMWIGQSCPMGHWMVRFDGTVLPDGKPGFVATAISSF